MRSTAIRADGIGVPEKETPTEDPHPQDDKMERGRVESRQGMLLKRQEQRCQVNGTQSHPNTVGMKKRKRRQTIAPSPIGLTRYKSHQMSIQPQK